MQIRNRLKNYVPSLIVALSACAALGDPGLTGQLWFGGQGSTTGTASGFTDNLVGHVNSDGTDPTLVAIDPGVNNCQAVGLDTADNLYFGLWSDGTLRSGYMTGGQLQSIQITDRGRNDVVEAFTVDPNHHIVYVGLWGFDPSGADLIEVMYNPTNGQMASPYDYSHGMITNETGVLLSETSTGYNFVLPRQMWVTPNGNQIYYVDNDNGDPEDATLDGEQLNGVYVVATTNANPQPEMLSLSLQFPGDETNGYIVGLAVNTPQKLIYFATTGPAPGVDTASNAIWSMPITGGKATVMPMPEGVSLVYPNFVGGCLAVDTNAQVLYVSDEGQGTVIQLSLSANGTSFTSGTTNFYTLDTNHLSDAGGFPSAYVQGIDFVSTLLPTPPALLNIVLQGGNAILSWPLADSSYGLQISPDLFSGDWTAYLGTPSIIGTNLFVTNAMNGDTTQFFRLAQ
jgi:hypothetical protein